MASFQSNDITPNPRSNFGSIIPRAPPAGWKWAWRTATIASDPKLETICAGCEYECYHPGLDTHALLVSQSFSSKVRPVADDESVTDQTPCCLGIAERDVTRPRNGTANTHST